MRSAAHRRSSEQLMLFHLPHRSPTWQNLSAEIRERTVKLMAQMLHDHVAGRLAENGAGEVDDE